MRRRMLLALGTVAVAVLGYGYWFAATHASLHISVDDTSDPNRLRPLDEAQVSFVDAAGTMLARARALPPHHAIGITSPAEYACADLERMATSSTSAREEWRRCLDRQSRWIPGWIGRVAAAEIRSGSCKVVHQPVTVATHGGEWWIWWVPLPHIGGKPYTLLRADFRVDLSGCR